MKTKIGMRISDGYLSFDHEKFNRHDENLVSWLEGVSPEDLLYGEFTFDVPVDLTWEHPDGGPLLEVADGV